MSRTAGTARSSAPRAAAARAVDVPVGRIVIRWSISADALPERFRPVSSTSPGEEAVLEVAIESAGGTSVASARLRAGGRERVIDLDPGPAPLWRRDPETGLEHVDIPGVVAATLRLSADGAAAETVYARTPLLVRLGLAGGRYEPSGVELHGT